jgi:plastocyanin
MQRRTVRTLLTAAVAGLLLTTGLALHVGAQQPGPMVATNRVLIYDNGGTFMPGDPATGQWTFAPHHVEVTQGDSIEFVNPEGNARPHTVTSITWSGQPPNRMLAHGTAFDSSPTMADIIRPGNTFTLDTSELMPGQYLYYCWLHPWMVGSITVMAAP